jgi:hypothetical protein
VETKDNQKAATMIRSVLVLAGALLLGGGIVACGSDDDASDVPPGVTSTLDAFLEATNTYDTEALGALVTEDFTWQSTGPVQSGPEHLAYIDANYENVGFHIELTSPRTIERDGDAYIATATDHVTTNSDDMTGAEVARLVDVDGSWLIQEFRWTEDAAS